MSESFDPYYEWLGIPPRHQPPNHYRLLGLELFEENADVIERATDRQMAHVRTFQTGKHSKDSQRLLNELSAAKICLLSAARKAEYDAQMRAQTPVAPPLAAPVVDRDAALSEALVTAPRISAKAAPGHHHRHQQVLVPREHSRSDQPCGDPLTGSPPRVHLAAGVPSKSAASRRRRPDPRPDRTCLRSPVTEKQSGQNGQKTTPGSRGRPNGNPPPSLGRPISPVELVDEIASQPTDPPSGGGWAAAPQAVKEWIDAAFGTVTDQFALLPDDARQPVPGSRSGSCDPVAIARRGAGRTSRELRSWSQPFGAAMDCRWRIVAGVSARDIEVANDRLQTQGFLPTDASGCQGAPELYLGLWFRPADARRGETVTCGSVARRFRACFHVAPYTRLCGRVAPVV